MRKRDSESEAILQRIRTAEAEDKVEKAITARLRRANSDAAGND